MLSINHVTMNFRMVNDKIDSLKEYIVKLLQGKLVYNKLTVLDDITFSVEKGEVIGIIGRNGAGKSTLHQGFYSPPVDKLKHLAILSLCLNWAPVLMQN